MVMEMLRQLRGAPSSCIQIPSSKPLFLNSSSAAYPSLKPCFQQTSHNALDALPRHSTLHGPPAQEPVSIFYIHVKWVVLHRIDR